MSSASAEPALAGASVVQSTVSAERISPSEPARAWSAPLTRPAMTRLSSAMRGWPSRSASQARSAAPRASIAEESRAISERVNGALRARAGSDGLIRSADTVDWTTLAPASAGSALALLTPDLGVSELQAARDLVSVGALASAFGVRSLDRDHPRRSDRNYWRGPVWANVTWLCAHALERHGEPILAAELRRRMFEAVARGGMREYVLPETGRGLGARDFSWTAALYLREIRA